MPEKESETYGVVLPGDLADQVNEYRDRRGLNKSEAGKQLIEAGLREKRRTTHFAARVAEAMIWIGAAATVTLLASLLWIAVLGQFGFALGINPWLLYNAAAIVVIVTGLGWFFRWSGAATWCDHQLAKLDTLFGAKS